MCVCVCVCVCVCGERGVRGSGRRRQQTCSGEDQIRAVGQQDGLREEQVQVEVGAVQVPTNRRHC